MKDLSTDPMIVRGRYAREAVHDAVIAGVTEHGADFRLTVEQERASSKSSDSETEGAKA